MPTALVDDTIDVKVHRTTTGPSMLPSMPSPPAPARRSPSPSRSSPLRNGGGERASPQHEHKNEETCTLEHRPSPQTIPAMMTGRIIRRNLSPADSSMSMLTIHTGPGFPIHGQNMTYFPRHDERKNISSSSNDGCNCKKSRCLKLYCQCFAQSSTCSPQCHCQDCNNTLNHVNEIQDARNTTLERNPMAFDKFSRGPSLAMMGPPPPPPYHHHHHHTFGPGKSLPPTLFSSALKLSSHNHPTVGHFQYPQMVRHHPGQLGPPHSIIAPGHPPVRENSSGCKCRKSFCLKKYCECFQNSMYCSSSCRCLNCGNHPSSSSISFPPPVPPILPPNMRLRGTSPFIHPSSTTNPVLHFPLESGCSNLSPPPGTPISNETSRTNKHSSVEDFSRKEHGNFSSSGLSPKTVTPKEKLTSDGDALAMMAAVAMAELGSETRRAFRPNENKEKEAQQQLRQTPTVDRKQTVKAIGDEASISLHSEEKGADPVIISPPTAVIEAQEKKRRRSDDLESPVRTLESRSESRNPSPAADQDQQDKKKMRSAHCQVAQIPSNSSTLPHENFQPTIEEDVQSNLTPVHLQYRSSHQTYSMMHPRGHPRPLAVSPTYGMSMPTPFFALDSSMPATSYPATSYSHFGPRMIPPPPSMFYDNHTGHMAWAQSSCGQEGSYGLVTQTKGLPNSLSFRKICSKCGKTRAEHGDCGFGNKCQFDTCGKCGAAADTHNKATCVMGVLCELTVEQGAIPGASEKYEKKIREIAARAELQKSIQQQAIW